HPAHARFFQVGHVLGVVDVAHGVHVAPAHADRHARQQARLRGGGGCGHAVLLLVFLAGAFFAALLRGGSTGSFATAAGLLPRGVFVSGSSLARKRPVCEAGLAAISSGVPVAMIWPPRWPPSGPRSTIQSAVLITSRLCSITTTVLPSSRSRCSTPSRCSMSWKCRPVVGSSRMYRVRPVSRRDSSLDSFTRCASPPDRVVALWPSLT